jgi:hypothetical protein
MTVSPSNKTAFDDNDKLLAAIAGQAFSSGVDAALFDLGVGGWLKIHNQRSGVLRTLADRTTTQEKAGFKFIKDALQSKPCGDSTSASTLASKIPLLSRCGVSSYGCNAPHPDVPRKIFSALVRQNDIARDAQDYVNKPNDVTSLTKLRQLLDTQLNAIDIGDSIFLPGSPDCTKQAFYQITREPTAAGVNAANAPKTFSFRIFDSVNGAGTYRASGANGYVAQHFPFVEVIEVPAANLTSYVFAKALQEAVKEGIVGDGGIGNYERLIVAAGGKRNTKAYDNSKLKSASMFQGTCEYASMNWVMSEAIASLTILDPSLSALKASAQHFVEAVEHQIGAQTLQHYLTSKPDLTYLPRANFVRKIAAMFSASSFSLLKKDAVDQGTLVVASTLAASYGEMADDADASALKAAAAASKKFDASATPAGGGKILLASELPSNGAITIRGGGGGGITPAAITYVKSDFSRAPIDTWEKALASIAVLTAKAGDINGYINSLPAGAAKDVAGDAWNTALQSAYNNILEKPFGDLAVGRATLEPAALWSDDKLKRAPPDARAPDPVASLETLRAFILALPIDVAVWQVPPAGWWAVIPNAQESIAAFIVSSMSDLSERYVFLFLLRAAKLNEQNRLTAIDFLAMLKLLTIADYAKQSLTSTLLNDANIGSKRAHDILTQALRQDVKNPNYSLFDVSDPKWYAQAKKMRNHWVEHPPAAEPFFWPEALPPGAQGAYPVMDDPRYGNLPGAQEAAPKDWGAVAWAQRYMMAQSDLAGGLQVGWLDTAIMDAITASPDLDDLNRVDRVEVSCPNAYSRYNPGPGDPPPSSDWKGIVSYGNSVTRFTAAVGTYSGRLGIDTRLFGEPVNIDRRAAVAAAAGPRDAAKNYITHREFLAFVGGVSDEKKRFKGGLPVAYNDLQSVAMSLEYLLTADLAVSSNGLPRWQGPNRNFTIDTTSAGVRLPVAYAGKGKDEKGKEETCNYDQSRYDYKTNPFYKPQFDVDGNFIEPPVLQTDRDWEGNEATIGALPVANQPSLIRAKPFFTSIINPTDWTGTFGYKMFAFNIFGAARTVAPKARPSDYANMFLKSEAPIIVGDSKTIVYLPPHIKFARATTLGQYASDWKATNKGSGTGLTYNGAALADRYSTGLKINPIDQTDVRPGRSLETPLRNRLSSQEVTFLGRGNLDTAMTLEELRSIARCSSDPSQQILCLLAFFGNRKDLLSRYEYQRPFLILAREQDLFLSHLRVSEASSEVFLAIVNNFLSDLEGGFNRSADYAGLAFLYTAATHFANRVKFAQGVRLPEYRMPPVANTPALLQINNIRQKINDIANLGSLSPKLSESDEKQATLRSVLYRVLALTYADQATVSDADENSDQRALDVAYLLMSFAQLERKPIGGASEDDYGQPEKKSNGDFKDEYSQRLIAPLLTRFGPQIASAVFDLGVGGSRDVRAQGQAVLNNVKNWMGTTVAGAWSRRGAAGQLSHVQILSVAGDPLITLDLTTGAYYENDVAITSASPDVEDFKQVFGPVIKFPVGKDYDTSLRSNAHKPVLTWTMRRLPLDGVSQGDSLKSRSGRELKARFEAESVKFQRQFDVLGGPPSDTWFSYAQELPSPLNFGEDYVHWVSDLVAGNYYIIYVVDPLEKDPSAVKPKYSIKLGFDKKTIMSLTRSDDSNLQTDIDVFSSINGFAAFAQIESDPASIRLWTKSGLYTDEIELSRLNLTFRRVTTQAGIGYACGNNGKYVEIAKKNVWVGYVISSTQFSPALGAPVNYLVCEAFDDKTIRETGRYTVIMPQRKPTFAGRLSREFKDDVDAALTVVPYSVYRVSDPDITRPDLRIVFPEKEPALTEAKFNLILRYMLLQDYASAAELIRRSDSQLTKFSTNAVNVLTWIGDANATVKADTVSVEDKSDQDPRALAIRLWAYFTIARNRELYLVPPTDANNTGAPGTADNFFFYGGEGDEAKAANSELKELRQALRDESVRVYRLYLAYLDKVHLLQGDVLTPQKEKRLVERLLPFGAKFVQTLENAVASDKKVRPQWIAERQNLQRLRDRNLALTTTIAGRVYESIPGFEPLQEAALADAGDLEGDDGEAIYEWLRKLAEPTTLLGALKSLEPATTNRWQVSTILNPIEILDIDTLSWIYALATKDADYLANTNVSCNGKVLPVRECLQEMLVEALTPKGVSPKVDLTAVDTPEKLRPYFAQLIELISVAANNEADKKAPKRKLARYLRQVFKATDAKASVPTLQNLTAAGEELISLEKAARLKAAAVPVKTYPESSIKRAEREEAEAESRSANEKVQEHKAQVIKQFLQVVTSDAGKLQKHGLIEMGIDVATPWRWTADTYGANPALTGSGSSGTLQSDLAAVSNEDPLGGSSAFSNLMPGSWTQGIGNDIVVVTKKPSDLIVAAANSLNAVFGRASGASPRIWEAVAQLQTNITAVAQKIAATENFQYRVQGISGLRTFSLELDREIQARRDEARRLVEEEILPIARLHSAELVSNDVARRLLLLASDRSESEQININDLLYLLLKGSFQSFFASSGVLAANEVSSLYRNLVRFLMVDTYADQLVRLKNSVDAVLDALDRGAAEGTTFENFDQNAADFQILLGNMVSAGEAARSYVVSDHVEYLIFEHFLNILIRREQAKALDQLNIRNGIIYNARALGALYELIPGGGKTSVILPLMSVLIADGESLNMVMLLEPLIANMSAELATQMSGAFRRAVEVMTISRQTGGLSLDVLVSLRTRFEQARIFGRTIVLTNSTAQSLFLSFVEALHNYGNVQDATINDRIKEFIRIFRFLRAYGRLIIDEVDAALDILQAHQFSVGKPIPLLTGDKPILKTLPRVIVAFYRLLAKDQSLQNRIQLSFIPKKPGAPAFSPSTYAQFKPYLLEAILKAGRDKAFFVGSPSIDGNFSELFNRCLISNPCAGFAEKYLGDGAHSQDRKNLFDAIDGLVGTESGDKERLKDLFSVLYDQIHVIFEVTASKKFGVHYGMLPSLPAKASEAAQTNYKKNQFIAVPYHSGEPQPDSRFQSAEAISYVMQMYLGQGNTGLRLLIDAEVAQLKIDETKTAVTSVAIDVRARKERYFKTATADLSTKPANALTGADKAAMTAYLATQIDDEINLIVDRAITQIKTYPVNLATNAQIYESMFASVFGFSGTIWNADEYAEIFQQPVPSDTTERTLLTLWLQGGPFSSRPAQMRVIRTAATPTVSDLLSQLYLDDPTNPSSPFLEASLMDEAGLFGIASGGNKEVAWALNSNLKASPKVEGTVFYDEANQPQMLWKGKADPDTVRKEDRQRRIAFWDKKHTTGSDIPLKADMKAVMTFDEHLTSRSLQQTVWRLRQLHQGQRIERYGATPYDIDVILNRLENDWKVAVDKNAFLFKLADMILYSVLSQEQDLGDLRFRSYFLKAANIFIGRVMTAWCLDRQTVSGVVRLYALVKDLFEKNIGDDPLYLSTGRPRTDEVTSVALANIQQEILGSSYAAALRRLEFFALDSARMAELELSILTRKMLPILPPTVIASGVENGSEVEVEAETEINIETNVQVRDFGPTEKEGRHQLMEWQIQKVAKLYNLGTGALDAPPDASDIEIVFKEDSWSDVPELKDVKSSTVFPLPKNSILLLSDVIDRRIVASYLDDRLFISRNLAPYKLPDADPNNPAPAFRFFDLNTPYVYDVLVVVETAPSDPNNPKFRMVLLAPEDAKVWDEFLRVERLFYGAGAAPAKPARDNWIGMYKYYAGFHNFDSSRLPAQVNDFGKLRAFFDVLVQAKYFSGVITYSLGSETDGTERQALHDFIEGPPGSPPQRKDRRRRDLRDLFLKSIVADREDTLAQYPTSMLANADLLGVAQ